MYWTRFVDRSSVSTKTTFGLLVRAGVAAPRPPEAGWADEQAPAATTKVRAVVITRLRVKESFLFRPNGFDWSAPVPGGRRCRPAGRSPGRRRVAIAGRWRPVREGW